MQELLKFSNCFFFLNETFSWINIVWLLLRRSFAIPWFFFFLGKILKSFFKQLLEEKKFLEFGNRLRLTFLWVFFIFFYFLIFFFPLDSSASLSFPFFFFFFHSFLRNSFQFCNEDDISWVFDMLENDDKFPCILSLGNSLRGMTFR